MNPVMRVRLVDLALSTNTVLGLPGFVAATHTLDFTCDCPCERHMQHDTDFVQGWGNHIKESCAAGSFGKCSCVHLPFIVLDQVALLQQIDGDNSSPEGRHHPCNGTCPATECPLAEHDS